MSGILNGFLGRYSKFEHRSSSFEQKAKFWLRHCFGAVQIQQKPFKRPIIMFSGRRSGSTLLGRVITAQRGIVGINQPLATNWYQPYRPIMPPTRFNQYVSLTNRD